jgi:hypothetical protein
LGEVGEAGEEGIDEGSTLDRGERRKGASFHSTTKARRKALSKKYLSNKSTSLCNNNKSMELNLIMSTSFGS